MRAHSIALATFALLPFIAGCFEKTDLSSATGSSGTSTSIATSLGFLGIKSASNLDGSRNTITWALASGSTVTAYRVYTVDSDGTMTLIKTLGPKAVSYTHTGLTACTVYTYNVQAVDVSGATDGNLVTASALTYAGITSITTVSTTSATVTYPACSNASSLTVSCGSISSTAANTSTSTTLTGLTASTSYSCSVTATTPTGATDGNTNTITYGIGAACMPRPSGLVSWWDADSFTGLVSSDLVSSSANNAIFSTGTTTASGEVSNAFSLTGYQTYGTVTSASNLTPTTTMTAMAWVYPNSNTSYAYNAPIISKGDFVSTMASTGFSTFNAATNVSSNLSGLTAAAFDGRYVYYVGPTNSYMARYDTTQSFTSANSWATLDATLINAANTSLNGLIFDGRYLYLVPRSGTVVTRYDTTLNYTSTSSYSTFDASVIAGGLGNNKGFIGGSFDGRYIYFSPNIFAIYSGYVLRYDTTGTFTAAASWTNFDTTTVNANLKGFGGSLFDGRYVYFIPYTTAVATYSGLVVRYDTTASFTSAASWTTFDMTTISGNYKGYFGGSFDGRYIYFAPLTNGAIHGNVARYDTTAPFTSTSSWNFFDTSTVTASAKAFTSAIFDGKYVYFIPSNGAASGVVARLDTTSNFLTSGAWSTYDTTGVSASAKGYYGSTFDGRYMYLVPYNNGATDAFMVQYDTQGSTGFTYSLRAMQANNGGLGYSFQGPTFQITTASGTYSVSSSTGLSTGSWHHIAGVYDGSQIRIYADGVLMNTMPASGALASNSSSLKIGSAGTANSSYNGMIDEAQIYNTALTTNQIFAVYTSGTKGVCK